MAELQHRTVRGGGGGSFSIKYGLLKKKKYKITCAREYELSLHKDSATRPLPFTQSMFNLMHVSIAFIISMCSLINCECEKETERIKNAIGAWSLKRSE